MLYPSAEFHEPLKVPTLKAPPKGAIVDAAEQDKALKEKIAALLDEDDRELGESGVCVCVIQHEWNAHHCGHCTGWTVTTVRDDGGTIVGVTKQMLWAEAGVSASGLVRDWQATSKRGPLSYTLCATPSVPCQGPAHANVGGGRRDWGHVLLPHHE